MCSITSKPVGNIGITTTLVLSAEKLLSYFLMKLYETTTSIITIFTGEN